MKKAEEKRIADSRFEEMAKLRAEGKTVTEIAAHFNVTKQRVSELFIEHGQPLRKFMTDDDVIRIADPEEIARTFDVTVLHAKMRMKRLGLPYEQHSSGRKAYSTWNKENVGSMYEDYKSGMTQKAISFKYGIAQNTVSMLLIKYGYLSGKRSK